VAAWRRAAEPGRSICDIGETERSEYLVVESGGNATVYQHDLDTRYGRGTEGEQRTSGHAMALASVAYVLWDRHLRHNPTNPNWPNRDRFVLSNGHA
jgi:hypothetical protein